MLKAECSVGKAGSLENCDNVSILTFLVGMLVDDVANVDLSCKCLLFIGWAMLWLKLNEYFQSRNRFTIYSNCQIGLTDITRRLRRYKGPSDSFNFIFSRGSYRRHSNICKSRPVERRKRRWRRSENFLSLFPASFFPKSHLRSDY